MTAGHPVTPSEEVDQVWHLHLAYTRSYWDDLCGTVLGGPLHHGPTRGGKRERTRYDQQYRQTLDSYERAFGGKPPKDIWPGPEERFRNIRYHIVDRSLFWLTPRFTKTMALTAAFIAAILSVALLAFPPRPPWQHFVWVAAVVCLVSAALVYVVTAVSGDFTRRSASETKDGKKDAGCGGGCS
ncbi:MAG: hypothetical protein J0H41_10255 [Rhizobiales bacterium]|nr:hypothetical protein [Hyphomicrobiales bacterium]